MARTKSIDVGQYFIEYASDINYILVVDTNTLDTCVRMDFPSGLTINEAAAIVMRAIKDGDLVFD